MNPKPKRPPKTIKEKAFVKALVKTTTAAEAARIAGYKDPIQAAYENKIKLDLPDLMDKKGLTDDHLLDKLDEGLESNRVISAIITDKQANGATNDFIEVPDMVVRHKYLETALKLKGKLQPASNQTNVQINNVIPIIGLEPYVPGDNSNPQDISAQEEN